MDEVNARPRIGDADAHGEFALRSIEGGDPQEPVGDLEGGHLLDGVDHDVEERLIEELSAQIKLWHLFGELRLDHYVPFLRERAECTLQALQGQIEVDFLTVHAAGKVAEEKDE